MIRGIGIDICSTQRINKVINKNNSNFIKDTFSQSEIKESQNYKNQGQFFASRFAAKEAFLKSLGLGLFNEKLSFNEISIEKKERGKPFIKIYNDEILKNLEKSNIPQFLVC